MVKWISEDFRQSMDWLHTWLGIALSAILFVVFWTGTLTVFDREIDQWMKPELRLPATEQVSLDEVALPALARLDIEPGATVWIGPPRGRFSAIRLYYEDSQHVEHEVFLNPYTGDILDPTDSDAGTEFFFHFHFMLHLPGLWGYILVGLASIGMMVLVVSGVFIHRKIFTEFFTFRPDKKARRKALDLHNLTAVVALPFHFIIPFSGLIILATTYYPWSIGVPYEGDARQFRSDTLAYEMSIKEPAGIAAPPPASIDTYVDRAQAIWRNEDGERSSTADWVAIFNYRDANSYVMVERYFADQRVAIGPDQVVFDSTSGAVSHRFEPLPVHNAANWIEGIHWMQFDHWTLRWLLFLGGLSGCVMIATGLIFWIEARIRKGVRDPVHIRVIRAISIGSVTGVIGASCAFLIANRLLPKEIGFTNIPRHELEIWAFFGIWIASFAHASIRGKAAWRDQGFAIGGMALLALALNWLSTGHHPIAAIRLDLWNVVAMDLVIMAGAVSAFLLARSLPPQPQPLRQIVQAPAESSRSRLPAE